MNWKDSLFVFDSNGLDRIQTRLYGYIVSDSEVIDEECRRNGRSFSPTGIGSYDYIERVGDTIVVQQDFLGSQGIYLYREEGYFALSNSELLLIEHLKRDHRLTLNRDYALHLVSSGHVVKSAEDTMVREIAFLDRHIRITIDIPSKSLQLRNRTYDEHTICPDSMEGIGVLDAWCLRWIETFRKAYATTDNVEIDLSGGFDSRLSFALMTRAGIDLDRIVVRSLNDGLHTHDEDFRIASQIADAFGFPLNNYRYERLGDSPFKLEDILGLSLYAKGLEHKQMYYKFCLHRERKYRITGAGGEDIRARSTERWSKVIEQQNNAARKVFSKALLDEAASANRTIMAAGYARVRNGSPGLERDELDATAEAVLDTWHRFHFGKDMLECYLCNEIKLLPLLDPDLLKLKLYGSGCPDRNLLMAMIFVRYCPRLLDFPFSGDRTISDETIAYARRINERHPLPASLSFDRLQKGGNRQSGADKGRPGPIVPETAIQEAIRMLTASPTIQTSFCQVADGTTYENMVNDSAQRVFHPLCQLFAILAVGLCQHYVSESGKGSSVDFFQLLKDQTSWPCRIARKLAELFHGIPWKHTSDRCRQRNPRLSRT